MKTAFKTSVCVMLACVIVSSCMPRKGVREAVANDGSKMSSITMPMPDKLKNLIGPSKINAYNLSIASGTCDQGVTGTKIEKFAAKLEITGVTLANEKLRQGCAYTITISLGKVDSAGKKLEKIYLTNDAEGKRTHVAADATRSSNIKVTALLFVTDDAKKDLGINDQAILVPSGSDSDADINIDIGKNPSKSTPSTGDYDWRVDAKITMVPTYSFSGKEYGSSYYKDLMNHTPESQRDFQGGTSTHAHETMHGLQSVMRNSTREHDGFFYIENGQGLAVTEPKENLKDVKNHIGDSYRKLSQGRYDLYLVQQTTNWPNTLYIFDEWNAYVATTRAAVEIKKAGQWDVSGNSDPIEGVVDFMYFCSASMISMKIVDPDYLKTNKQYKAAYAMIMEESVKWYNEAKKEPLWIKSSAWEKMENFRSSSDGAKVREIVKEVMGDVWTKRILGF